LSVAFPEPYLDSLPERTYVYQEGRDRIELLQGTLDLLVLQTLLFRASAWTRGRQNN